MRVMKFGGTSVGDGERILGAARLVAERAGFDQGRGAPLAVVSAMGGVTDRLLAFSSASRAGDRAAAGEALHALGEKHRGAVDAMALPGSVAVELRGAIEKELVRLGELSTGVSLLGELSPRTSDAVAAAGEILSSLLFTAAVEKAGAAAVRIDPRGVMPTDARFGAAVPDEARLVERMRERVLPETSAGKVVVTGGFVGSAPDGSATTLGRGGSDYSAALFGAALADAGADVEAIEIWTDVDGILTADPRIVPGARLLAEVSADEAAELAFFGAKVLHPATIRPAVARGVPVVVRNTFRPEGTGTVVRRDVAGEGVRALATRKGVAALFVQSPRMLLAAGFAARVFSVFERRGVPVDVITTSEVSISTTVDAKAPIDELVLDLSEFCDVTVLRRLAVVSVVGSRIRSTPGVAARVFGALRGVNVVLISQGASDTNLTCVVSEDDSADALRLLHREFFE